MKKSWFLFLAAMLTAALLCSCGGKRGKDAADGASVRYKEGGADVISLAVTNFDTFNPILTTSDTVLELDSLVYDSLFRRSADFSMLPVLAERVERSADGLVYTVSLRRDVTWHDGGRFSAYDVEYTVHAIENADTSRWKRKLYGIESHTAKDNYTYVFTLSAPNSAFINRLDFPIVKRGTPCIEIEPDYVPVGTSAYRYTPSDLNRAHIFRLNTDCVTVQTGSVQELIVKEIPDADYVMYALESREIEAAHVDGEQLMTYSAKGNITTVPYTNTHFTFLGVNADTGALADKQVRRALSLLIDREAIGTGAMFGRFVPAELPLIPGSRYYPVQTQEETENAQTLLQRAGYQKDASGLWYTQVDAQMQYLSFGILVNTENTVRCAAAEELVKALRAAGIDAHTEQVDFDAYTERIADDAYTLFLGEVIMDEDWDLRMFAGSGARYSTVRGQNWDTLLANVRIATTETQLERAYAALTDAFSDEMPILSLGFGQNALLINDRIGGEIRPVYQNIFGGFAGWKSKAQE